MEIGNKNSNQPLTLGDFQEFTSGLGVAIAETVREEIQPFQERMERTIAATVREEIQPFQERMERTIAATVREEMRPFEERIELKITEFKSETLTGVDAVLKEVKTIREEQIMKVGRDDRQDQDITKLKTHVAAVEEHIGLANAAS